VDGMDSSDSKTRTPKNIARSSDNNWKTSNTLGIQRWALSSQTPQYSSSPFTD
jgi:hypothetical protein